MPFSNYIYEYCDGITTGKIVVGKWVRLIYEYIVSGLQNGLFFSTQRRRTRQFSLSKTSAIIARDEPTF